MTASVSRPPGRIGRPRASPVRGRAVVLGVLIGLAGLAPARADSEMKQSPLMMRRAGPSCQPGDLGAEPGAGYFYRLGPCAGPDRSDGARGGDAPEVRRRRRR